MDEERSDFNLLGFILASNYRTKIILLLGHQAATPKQMAKVTNLRTGHVSNILKGLVNKDLVECINPEAKKGRIYRLTSTGKQVGELMKKLGLNKTS